jgi:thiosulfate dehydrogenase [quinone] large subunit
MPTYSRAQAIALVLLRTLVGWHFLYEGYYKLVLPAWTRGGTPIGKWSAAGYLAAASGPLAGAFHALGTSAGPSIDVAVPLGLVLIGLSLMLGLFTRVGCWGAMLMLGLFYLSAIPLTGAPVPGQEGEYILVSKNLIELVAVAVILTSRTERIAGLDLLLSSSRTSSAASQSAA